MLIMISYSISCWPGEPLEGIVAPMGMLMGTWPCNVSNLTSGVVMDSVRTTYVSPLVAAKKANTMDAIGAKHLACLKQLRSLVMDKIRITKFKDGAVEQWAEYLDGELLTVVHNIKLIVVPKG